MDLKKKVSSIHTRIKELGYSDFKRTHCQEVLATALGYRNFHALKAKVEGNPLQDALYVLLKREKHFLLKLNGSSISEDFWLWNIDYVKVKISEQDINKIEEIQSSDIFDQTIQGIRCSFSLQVEDVVMRELTKYIHDEDIMIETTDNNQTGNGTFKVEDELYQYESQIINKEHKISVEVRKDSVLLIVELFTKKEILIYTGEFYMENLKDMKWRIL